MSSNMEMYEELIPNIAAGTTDTLYVVSDNTFTISSGTDRIEQLEREVDTLREQLNRIAVENVRLAGVDIAQNRDAIDVLRYYTNANYIEAIHTTAYDNIQPGVIQDMFDTAVSDNSDYNEEDAKEQLNKFFTECGILKEAT